jgi:hypothetical protein
MALVATSMMESLPRLEHVQGTKMPSVSMRKPFWTKHQPQQDPAERGLERHTGDARWQSLSCLLGQAIYFLELPRCSKGSRTTLRRPEAPKHTSYNPLKALQGPSPVTLNYKGLQTFEYAARKRKTHSRLGGPETSMHATEKWGDHRNTCEGLEAPGAIAAPGAPEARGTIGVTRE